MNTIQHTPGPWRVDGLLIKAIDHGKWFGIAKAGGTKLTIEGNMANARLIATAPELLEALQTAVHYLGFEYASTDPHMVEIYAAIAKAKGANNV
jgi:hypothetical protein